MADILLVGHVVGIRHVKSWVSMRIAERRAGYTRKDGVRVQPDYLVFRVLFKEHLRSYIQTYIPVDSLVKVKGTIVPYSTTDKDTGVAHESFTIFGQTIDMFPYPSRSALRDNRALEISSRSDEDMGEPDLGKFSDDF